MRFALGSWSTRACGGSRSPPPCSWRSCPVVRACPRPAPPHAHRHPQSASRRRGRARHRRQQHPPFRLAAHTRAHRRPAFSGDPHARRHARVRESSCARRARRCLPRGLRHTHAPLPAHTLHSSSPETSPLGRPAGFLSASTRSHPAAGSAVSARPFSCCWSGRLSRHISYPTPKSGVPSIRPLPYFGLPRSVSLT